MRRVGVLFAVLVFAGCTAVAPTGAPATTSVPAVSPSVATASATATPTPTSTSRPQSGYLDAAPNGTTVAAFADTWVGDSILPAGNETADTVWNVRLVIKACARGEACGEFHIATKKAAWSGKPESCDYAISRLGYELAGDAFVFGEKVTGQSGHKCYTMLLNVTPLAGGAAIAIQQIFSGAWEDAGILRRSYAP